MFSFYVIHIKPTRGTTRQLGASTW